MLTLKIGAKMKKPWKECKQDFVNFLLTKNINFIWHITKLSNLSSIVKYGYLFSQNELKNRQINFNSSSNDLSKHLDEGKNIQDFVRFAFTFNNPLFLAFIKRHPDDNFCVFRMDIFNLLTFDDVVFSNINATDKTVLFFDDFESFCNKLDFEAFLCKDTIAYGDQAEIMINKEVEVEKLTIAQICIQKRRS